MDTISAFAMGMANQGRPKMVFDWKRCAEIIRDENPQEVEAGLSGDWEWTGGVIFKDGKIVDDQYTYLSSNWARPQVCVDGDYRDCFVMKSDANWDSGTKWPEEARAILESDAMLAARERKGGNK
jgi:hypothetical protein